MYFPIPASAKQFVMSDMRLIVARRPVVFHEFDERKARRVLDRKRKDKVWICLGYRVYILDSLY